MTDLVLVCTACGSPSCWSGELMCHDAMRADIAPCSCEWARNSLGDAAGGAHPLVVNPGCYIHGEVP